MFAFHILDALTACLFNRSDTFIQRKNASQTISNIGTMKGRANLNT